MDGLKCEGFEFFYHFDSANLAKVEAVPAATINVSKTLTPDIPDIEFNIWTKPDCAETEFENCNRTWFYFGMKANASALLVKLNMVDLNRQGKMYSQGMAPVYKIAPGKPHWERIRDKPVHSTLDNIFTLSFKYRTPENIQSITYFAFTYPFSYTELQNMLNNIDTRFLNVKSHPLKDDIYYTRECVCHTLEGRRVDLVTISSYHDISSEREIRLKNLFPDENVPRPFKFLGKKVIFISARVHPGETPSSYVFNGFLNMLLNREDHVGVTLRRNYVFKLIPMLNPDGVAKGHYRTDTRGVNLNRVYLNPSLTLHPSIYASRALIRYYHFGFEKEDVIDNDIPVVDRFEDSSFGEDSPQNGNKLSKKVSHMSLEEKAHYWSCHCKKKFKNVKSFVTELSNIIASLDDDSSLSAGKDVCCSKNSSGGNISSEGEEFLPAVCSHGDANCNESGIYLYMDMHGHASKKGIFLYGNHFDDLECKVECMLLPKIMSLNNLNFHFTACNFTERNMYLRDRRDGMSREGSGRVAVLKLTGLVRSYTLECNYNTGRLVNILPPAIKDPKWKTTNTVLVPPKYTPQVFEEVGRALGASILDLTGQNPCTRIPNSEFHTLNGLKDWLRINGVHEIGEARSLPPRLKLKNSGLVLNQGKPVRGTYLKTRSSSVKIPCKKIQSKTGRAASVPIDRKENIAFQSQDVLNSQPSCSRSTRPRITKTLRPKAKRESLRFKSTMSSDRPTKNINHVVRNMQNTNCLVRQRLKQEKDDKSQKVKENMNTLSTESSDSRMQLREICFIKGAEGKTVIAKYKSSEKSSEACSENLIVAWDATTNHPQVYSEKEPVPLVDDSLRRFSEPGPSRQGAFRVHNFVKSSPFKKVTKRIPTKRTLRRHISNTEAPAKVETLKKRKKVKRKM